MQYLNVKENYKYSQDLVSEYLYRRANSGTLQLDDNSVAFFLRRLDQTIGRVFESLAPELSFADDCVQEFDLDPGAENLVYPEIDNIAEAKIIGGATDDVRIANFQAEEVQLKKVRIGIGYDYTDQELDNMLLASKNGVAFDVKEQRIKGALQGLDELADNLGYYGNSVHNIAGMFNHPNTTVIDSAFKPYLATGMTANLLYQFFVDSYWAVRINTEDRLKPNVCRMSLPLMRRLTSVRDSESNKTAWDLINEFLGQIEGVNFATRPALFTDRLKRNGILASNEDKEILAFYRLSPDTMLRKLNAVRSKPLESRGFRYIGRLFYDVSSVMIPYGKSANFIKYSTATV